MKKFRTFTYTAYKIINSSNEKIYIGITTRTLEQRWRQHLSMGNNNKGYKLHKAMNKIGTDKFKINFLFKTLDWEEINKYERKMITKYDSINKGYNTNLGGSFGDGSGIEIEIKGRKFISIGAAARFYNIDPSNAFQRLRYRKWTVRQAFGIEPPPVRDIWKDRKDARSITVNGNYFNTFRAACVKYNENEDKIRGRLNNGWTPDQAFGFDAPREKPLSNNVIKLKVEGVTFASLSKAAKHYNLGYNVVARRYHKGWKINQIFGLSSPPPPTPIIGRKIRLSGINFNSLSEAARYFKVTAKKAENRMRIGWSKEEAFELKKRKFNLGGEQNGKKITVGGKEFSSMKKAAEFHGLDHRKVWKRINKFKWNTREAFNLIERKK